MSVFGNQPAVNVPEHLQANSIHQQNSDENYGLFEASAAGDIKKVKKYIAAGASPNFFVRPEDQKNALHVASENGHIEVVEILLKAGAVVDCIASTSQATALIFASQNSNAAITKILIDAGANVNKANGYGNTALINACTAGHAEVAKTLLENRKLVLTDCNKKGSNIVHAIGYCNSIYDEKMLDILKLVIGKLEESGLSSLIDAKDNNGLSPYLVYAMNGKTRFMKLLSEHGCDVNMLNSDNKNAAQIAVFYKQKDVISYLNKK